MNHPNRVRRLRGDTGSVYALEVAVVLPIVIVLILGVIQAGAWWHGQHLARAAASEGARAARLLGGTPGDGQTAAERYLDRFAGPAVDAPVITINHTTDRVTVTVAGTALTVVPGLDAPIRATVTYPVERPRGATP